jgi:pantoate--beta-alanine ligase
LNIVDPTTAYFGQKDWQQFAVIRHLVSELNFPTNLKSVPTTRESDGLAMSSRNKRLDKDQRAKSIIFYEALKFSESLLKNGRDMQQVKDEVANLFNTDADVRLEYFELADSANLKSISSVEKANLPILCIAGYVGDIRLIDNMFIDLSSIQ